MIWIVIRSDAAIRCCKNAGGRVVDAGQLFERQVSRPVVRVIVSRDRKCSIATLSDGNEAGSLITNVPVYIRIDNILRSAAKLGDSCTELLPVSCKSQLVKVKAERFGVIDGPLQS